MIQGIGYAALLKPHRKRCTHTTLPFIVLPSCVDTYRHQQFINLVPCDTYLQFSEGARAFQDPVGQRNQLIVGQGTFLSGDVTDRGVATEEWCGRPISYVWGVEVHNSSIVSAGLSRVICIALEKGHILDAVCCIA